MQSFLLSSFVIRTTLVSPQNWELHQKPSLPHPTNNITSLYSQDSTLATLLWIIILHSFYMFHPSVPRQQLCSVYNQQLHSDFVNDIDFCAVQKQIIIYKENPVLNPTILRVVYFYGVLWIFQALTQSKHNDKLSVTIFS